MGFKAAAGGLIGKVRDKIPGAQFAPIPAADTVVERRRRAMSSGAKARRLQEPGVVPNTLDGQ